MEDFTRKFNAAQDKSVQIHHVLTTVYEALKEKGYDIDTIPIFQIGATIGVHTGPYPLGIGVVKRAI